MHSITLLVHPADLDLDSFSRYLQFPAGALHSPSQSNPHRDGPLQALRPWVCTTHVLCQVRK
jgi:hypothetical protein